MHSYKEIVLGAGCFWCIEAFYNEIKGVISATSGYSGGNVPGYPTYREVCSGLTGHAEVVKIVYDETMIDLKTIFVIFFSVHNPTTLNQQGADVGTQYRSVIFFKDNVEKELALQVKNELQKYFDDPIVTEISPLVNYFEAEAYHQNYYKLNPDQGYCSVVITPKIKKLRTLYKDFLK